MATLSLQHSDWRIAVDGTLLAQLRAQPTLKKMIIDAQNNDKELQEKIPLIKDGVKSEFSVKENGSLYFRDRLCVSTDRRKSCHMKLITQCLPCILEAKRCTRI